MRNHVRGDAISKDALRHVHCDRCSMTDPLLCKYHVGWLNGSRQILHGQRLYDGTPSAHICMQCSPQGMRFVPTLRLVAAGEKADLAWSLSAGAYLLVHT